MPHVLARQGRCHGLLNPRTSESRKAIEQPATNGTNGHEGEIRSSYSCSFVSFVAKSFFSVAEVLRPADPSALQCCRSVAMLAIALLAAQSPSASLSAAFPGWIS